MHARSLSRSAMLQKTLLVCLILAPFCAASDHWKDWQYDESHEEVRQFVAGGTLHLRVPVGDVQIRRGDSDKIRMHYMVKSKHESHVKDTRVDINVNGRDARIEFETSGSNTSVDVELEVPQNTNLDVHAKVGDVTVEGIEGDKDLDLGVGDIRISRDESSYRLVRASTSIGDVNQDVDHEHRGEVSGWLGKTLRYSGDGKYELRAHVSVGDITIEGK
jgi:hypothetical protein